MWRCVAVEMWMCGDVDVEMYMWRCVDVDVWKCEIWRCVDV